MDLYRNWFIDVMVFLKLTTSSHTTISSNKTSSGQRGFAFGSKEVGVSEISRNISNIQKRRATFKQKYIEIKSCASS
jgi:hypothetical protein